MRVLLRAVLAVVGRVLNLCILWGIDLDHSHIKVSSVDDAVMVCAGVQSLLAGKLDHYPIPQLVVHFFAPLSSCIRCGRLRQLAVDFLPVVRYGSNSCGDSRAASVEV